MNYGYLRLSTSELNQSNSFDIQRNHIETKFDMDSIYQDTCSGSTPFFKRDGWTKLMAIVKSGDIIYVHRLDRLSRDTLHFLVMEAELKKMNVDIIFIDGVNGDNPTDTLIRTILSAVSEFEKKMIALRIQQQKNLARMQGKHLSGAINFGYTKNDDGYLVEQPEEQRLIKEMKRLRDTGLSYQKVTDYINAKGHLSRVGKPFTKSTVYKAITYVFKEDRG